uniref:Uncharacterized protein n=1 Tax=Opuntia streptacantha TaxID=393608 RepID=A0A7C9FLD6_OPUST
MSQFPPFSLPGIVLAASLAIFSHSGVPFSICTRSHAFRTILLVIMNCLLWHFTLLVTFPSRQPLGEGKFASGLEWRTSQSFRDWRPFSSTSLSLSFHISSSCFDGAVPIIPGWVKPGKRTPGM